METVWWYAIISVGVISTISLIGVILLSFAAERMRKVLFLMVSFSAGALMGDAFLHLLPELIEENGFTLSISIAVLSGIASFFLLEKIIHWRHCHHALPHEQIQPFALTNLVGDGIHNFIDGIVIGASYLVSVPVGIATTVAVIMHEIPQEVSDFGVLLQGGYSKRRALWLNFLVALTSVFGVVAVLLLGGYVTGITNVLIAFTSGAFVYIAGADLIPELHKEVDVKKSFGQFIFFIFGILVMMSLLLLE